MKKIFENLKIMFKALVKPDDKRSLIPNWLSFSRCIFGPVIPVMTYLGAPTLAIFGTISGLVFTDFIDGKIARKITPKPTRGGALLDAISDKVFSLSLILGAITLQPIFIINGVLEAYISIINGKAMANGKEPKSNLLGKLKTWPLFISLIFAYLGIAVTDTNLFSNIAIALSLITIPLECINIKEYKDAAKTYQFKLSDFPKTENNTEKIEDEKTLQKDEKKTIANNNFVGMAFPYDIKVVKKHSLQKVKKC